MPLKRASPQPSIGTPTALVKEASNLLCASALSSSNLPVVMPTLAPAASRGCATSPLRRLPADVDRDREDELQLNALASGRPSRAQGCANEPVACAHGV